MLDQQSLGAIKRLNRNLKSGNKAACLPSCRQTGPSSSVMNYKSYADLSTDIRKNLGKVSWQKFDLVVGMPRSGMIPSYMLSLSLNIHCTDLVGFISNRPLIRGNTRKCRRDITHPHEALHILVVDDAILSGHSLAENMGLIPDALRGRVTTLAVYSISSHPRLSRDDIDIYFEQVLMPCVFEWNLFHNLAMKSACVDIDGVLCVDPTPHQDDDGERYRDFLETAEPLHLPTVKIHALVTSRLEKYRKETECWLKKNGVKYENLIMLDLPNKETRLKLTATGKYKAEYYKNSSSQFFVESEIQQAIEICKLTGKFVYCIENNVLYTPRYLREAVYNFRGLFNRLILRVDSFLRTNVRRIKHHIR